MSKNWDNNHRENSYTSGNKTEENLRSKPKMSRTNGCDEDHEDENKNVSLYGLCFGQDPEKDIAEQSKVILNMIYFFQVLPFYILQFTSGMALGNKNWSILVELLKISNDNLGFPSILVPQLIASNNTDIQMDINR